MLTLFACCLLASPQTPEPPMSDLKASYPYGGPRAVEVSSDNKVAFVAEGAVIAMLDLTQLSQNAAPVIDRVEVPKCAPMALAHLRPTSGTDWLFIAGGSQGLWRVTLCSGLFASPPTGCGSYAVRKLDVVETANWERKVCIDVAVVPNNAAAGVPLLCAIYSARQDAVGSTGTALPSEARFYRLDSSGTVTQYGASVPLVSSATSASSKAFAVAADPADSNSVYVSMGSGWLHKIDLTTSSFVLSPVATNPAISHCGGTSCPAGERMRDIAIVHTATHGSLLYAALDYGRVLEFELATGASRETSVDTGGTRHGYTDRIAAVTDGADNVMIAAANQLAASTPRDSWVIFRPLGVWYDQCLSYFADDCSTGLPPGEVKLHYYKRDFASPPPAPGSALIELGTQDCGEWWGSVVLRQLTSSRYASVESSLVGTTIRRILTPFTSSTLTVQSPLVTYQGPSLGAGDGLVVSHNSGFTYFGGEGGFPGLMYIQDSPRDLLPIAGTNAICPPSAPVPCSSCDPLGRTPNPYFGSIMGDTTWPDTHDPSDTQHDWIMSGDQYAWQQIAAQGCAVLSTCFISPCGSAACWARSPTTNGLNRPTWRVIRVKSAGINASSTSADVDLHWWQVAWDQSMEPIAYGSTPYVHVLQDLRTDSATGFPTLLYGLRGAAAGGCVIFDGADLGAQAVAHLPSAVGACGLDGGQGEFLAPHSITVITHPEIAAGTGCTIGASCSQNAARNLASNRGDTFTVTGPTGDKHYMLIIAAGFDDADPQSGCSWSGSYRSPLVDVFDATNVPPAQPGGALSQPTLVRVGIPPSNCTVQPACVNCNGVCNFNGTAWCVRVETLQVNGQTRTYAFVGDINARLMVFDVSYDQLFPSVSDIYASRLTPVGSVCLPINPWDNQRDNLIDLELDGSYAYCALGRGGVGVINILDPANPSIVDIVDTPGQVEGIVKRVDPQGHHQILAGDISGGLHLFGRVNE